MDAGVCAVVAARGHWSLVVSLMESGRMGQCLSIVDPKTLA